MVVRRKRGSHCYDPAITTYHVQGCTGAVSRLTYLFMPLRAVVGGVCDQCVCTVRKYHGQEMFFSSIESVVTLAMISYI